MKGISLFAASCVAVLLLGLFTPLAHADQWNQATKLTFSEPVEIPGTVLPAGTYWFTLMPDNPENNVVQVWGADRQHLIATILTIPDYRLQPTGKTVIRFEERPSSQPEALRAWFYPGDNFGHEFVYGESRAREIAKRTGQAVLSMRDEDAANITKPAKSVNEPSVQAMKHAQVQAINPSGQEVDKSQAVQETPQSTNNQTTMPQR